jgi:hypothetical protein
MMRTILRASVLAALLVGATSGAAPAQLFLGSRPDPQLTVGPLFVTATVTPDLSAVTVEVMWSLNVPAARSAADFEQTIDLLWPGEIVPDAASGPADPELNRHVQERGFTVIDDGRVPLLARSAYELETDVPPERIDGGAAFVTFVRQGGALGLTPGASYLRVRWHPKMTNRAWLMNLRFQARGLVKPKSATWVESVFWGSRHRFELAFNDVRSRALFPLYFEHRDRVLRLTDDPSQLVMLFSDAERLKVDEIAPGSAIRRRHESLESTEVISRFLDTSEGLVPQTLTVQFGYFSGLQSWAPVLIPVLFFVLGNAFRPLIAAAATRAGQVIAARVRFGGGGDGAQIARESGVLLSREQLSRIVPGRTTREEVLAIAGPDPEEFEDLAAPERHTLIYRGRRMVPRQSRRFGWLITMRGWDVEQHEVEIEIERDVVRDVHARVRRIHGASAHEGTVSNAGR